MKNILLTIITLSVLIDPFILSGQQYFKLLEVPENSYFQRLAQFSNGDILVGDAPKDILSGDSHRGYYLLRIDPCGNVLWANTYHFQGRHLTFDQFTIDDSDNIYTFGSALNGLKEEIYINKIAPDGQLIQERLYDAAVIDNVTYSIDYKEGRLAVFGFLFQSSIEKSTYVLMLDTNLNPIWQYLYDPFEAYGEAIMTKDLGVLYYTRNKIVKVDSEGQVEWAREIEHDYALSLSIPLHNLASLPHITVAGACATATHGSGVQNGNLTTAVRAIELVKPSGELVNLDQNHPDFNAVVVGLGTFGIITKVSLAVQDTFEVRQDVFLDLRTESLEEHFDEIMSAGYSVSLFTNWMDRKVSEIWIKRRIDANPVDLGSSYYRAEAATKNLHPIVALSAKACSEQMGVPGPWYDRLPHFKMGSTPSAGEELQSEYFVPRENAVEAMLEIEKMKEEIIHHCS